MDFLRIHALYHMMNRNLNDKHYRKGCLLKPATAQGIEAFFAPYSSP